MGLAWSNAKPAAIAAAAKSLAATQRADGGWSQLASMGSDAYATGEALYALNAAGQDACRRSGLCQGCEVPPEYAGRRRILAREDAIHLGSALFRERVPLWHDQWISAAGTGWATIALSLTGDPGQSASARATQIASNK